MDSDDDDTDEPFLTRHFAEHGWEEHQPDDDDSPSVEVIHADIVRRLDLLSSELFGALEHQQQRLQATMGNAGNVLFTELEKQEAAVKAAIQDCCQHLEQQLQQHLGAMEARLAALERQQGR